MFGLRLGVEGYVGRLRSAPGFMGVLSKYGADAHMWIPGVGMIDGFTVQNWQNGDGTISATVGNPVGRVADIGGGTVDLIRDVDATRPTLAIGVNGAYAWTLNGSFHKLPLAAPVFQLSDNFCVVAGVALTASGSAQSIFAQSNGSNHALPELMFDNTGRLGAYALGGGATVDSFGGPNNAALGPIVASMVNIGGAIRVRRNSVQIATVALSGAYSTATTSTIGAFPTLNASEFLMGEIYPVVVIKGTVSDTDLLAIENFVTAHSSN